MWFYDYRTQKNNDDPRLDITDINPPSIGCDRSSVIGFALTAFLTTLDELCKIHVMNNGDAEIKGFDPDNMLGFTENSGIGFANDHFILHAYDWDEAMRDDDAFDGYVDGNYPNATCFYDKETGACVSWYKYLPRGLCVNDEMIEICDSDTLGKVLSRLHSTLNA